MPEFEKLAVWRQAHDLALSMYRATKQFPEDERFGLTDQIRRAAASIPANIAEGKGRGTDREFAPFLRIAQGSTAETQALVLLARDLNLLDASDSEVLLNRAAEVAKMLGSLLGKLDVKRR